jgi:hypothetical protein
VLQQPLPDFVRSGAAVSFEELRVLQERLGQSAYLSDAGSEPCVKNPLFAVARPDVFGASDAFT